MDQNIQVIEKRFGRNKKRVIVIEASRPLDEKRTFAYRETVELDTKFHPAQGSCSRRWRRPGGY